MSVKITETDTGWDAFQATMASLKKQEADVGYEQEGSDFGLASLAAVQEFGTKIPVTDKMRGFLGSQGLHLKKSTTHITIPPRPFMRDSFDNNIDEIGETGIALANKALEGKITADETLEIWGDSFKAIIKNGVVTRSLGLAENADFTKERKGSETPLVHNSRLINGSTVTVRNK